MILSIVKRHALSASTFSRPFLALTLCVWMGSAATAAAQSPCDQALQIATDEYDQGYFDQATFRLNTCLQQDAFNPEQEKEAYLLLGRIYYANLQIDQARDSVRKLLEKNPAYELTPGEHKPGFVDLYQEVMHEVKETSRLPSSRSGFWGSFGIGPAEGNTTCNCPRPILFADDDPWNGGGSGGSFSLALGGTVNSKLQLGAELSQWERQADIEDSESTSSIGYLAFIAKYYPNEYGNFFLKGGGGVGTSTLEREVGPNSTIKLEASGLSLHFGLGYDILLGQSKKTALTPFINLTVLYVEEDVLALPVDDTNVLSISGPENPSFLQLGIAFTVL